MKYNFTFFEEICDDDINQLKEHFEVPSTIELYKELNKYNILSSDFCSLLNIPWFNKYYDLDEYQFAELYLKVFNNTRNIKFITQSEAMEELFKAFTFSYKMEVSLEFMTPYESLEFFALLIKLYFNSNLIPEPLSWTQNSMTMLIPDYIPIKSLKSDILETLKRELLSYGVLLTPKDGCFGLKEDGAVIIVNHWTDVLKKNNMDVLVSQQKESSESEEIIEVSTNSSASCDSIEIYDD